MLTTPRIARKWFLPTLLVFLVLASALAAQTQPTPPTVVFMTDFGVVDDSVALCKGVMYGIAPNLRIVDLTHQVIAFSISDGARFLFGASPYFPAGTVFVGVVDPTVGSTRKAIVVKTKRGQFFGRQIFVYFNLLLFPSADTDFTKRLFSPCFLVDVVLVFLFRMIIFMSM